jgi:TolB-like protein/DNA-binding winged helix-turn-helix (wHTH) protein/Flp pilus assembly protein TadD
MPMPAYRFHDMELDLDRYEIRRSGSPLKLEKIPMELLIFMVENAGRLVTREEIIEKLWGKDIFVDTEQGINTAVRKIRLALKEDAERPRFLETVVGKGYRFVAPVTRLSDAHAVSVESPAAANLANRAWPARNYKLAALAAVLLLAMLVFWVMKRPKPAPGASVVPIRALAVLPLENLSRDPAQEYFADGMTEALITDLGRAGVPRVISRTSVMRFKNARQPLPRIARDLNVDAVIEGAVLVSDNRVRVTAQLIRADSDQHLWAESYERDLKDVLALQAEIASDIARQVRVEIARQEGQPQGFRTVHPQAYSEYLKGRYAWNQRSEVGLQEGIGHFQRSIQLDPEFAAAYSGLADSWTTLGYLSYRAPVETFPLAKAAAERALQLDASLAEPHASLGYYYLYYEWNWTEAEKELQRAIALDPNYATGHHWYSVYLSAAGRPEQAMAEIQRARELDPLSLIINTDVGFHLYYAGRYDEAIASLRRTLEMNPRFPIAHLWLGRALQEKGQYAEAIAEYEKVEAALHDWPVTSAAAGHVYGTWGKSQDAAEVLRHLKALSRRRFVTSYGVALVYAGMGNKENAFAMLDRAVRERSNWLVWLKLDPRWEKVRSDPRFPVLLRKVGFPG